MRKVFTSIIQASLFFSVIGGCEDPDSQAFEEDALHEDALEEGADSMDIAANDEDVDPRCVPVITDNGMPGMMIADIDRVFFVKGQCLPSTLALWIAECAGMKKIKSSSTVVQFGCRPSYSGGYKDWVIKTKSGGTVLQSSATSEPGPIYVLW